MEIKDKIAVKVTADTSELDQITEKAERFCKLMNEAMELVDSIAHTNLDIRLSAVSDRKTTELGSIVTDVPTCELVKELEKREAVSTIIAEPYQDVCYKVNGPATVLIVTD